jgi:hypothetical protein
VAAETVLASRPEWHAFAEYFRLREQGLRKSAFKKLEEFLSLAQEWSEPSKREFVDTIMGLQASTSALGNLLSYQLKKAIIDPTLERWITDCPTSPIPLRWRGHTDDLRRAVALDAGEQIARQRLIDHLCGQAEFAMHHLPDYFIGTVADALAALNEAAQLLPELNDQHQRSEYQHEHDILLATLQVYQRYGATGSELSFASWLNENPLERARCIRWVKAFYYKE